MEMKKKKLHSEYDLSPFFRSLPSKIYKHFSPGAGPEVGFNEIAVDPDDA